jgi:hypothetical protein
MSKLGNLMTNLDPKFYLKGSHHIYCATDEPSFWSKHNLKEHPALALERSKTYSYKYNDEAFRCDDFTNNSEFPIVFLGCSHTSGVGLELQDVWANVLLEKIKDYTGKKIPFWNLAVPGSSIDQQALLLEKYIHKLNPRLIFFLVPGMYRRRIILENVIIDYLPGGWVDYSQLSKNVIKKLINKEQSLFLDEGYAAFESYRNLLLINSAASSNKSKIYYNIGIENCETMWTDNPDCNIIQSLCDKLSNFNNLDTIFKNRDLARDGMHLGKISHREFAENVFEKIKDQL